MQVGFVCDESSSDAAAASSNTDQIIVDGVNIQRHSIDRSNDSYPSNNVGNDKPSAFSQSSLSVSDALEMESRGEQWETLKGDSRPHTLSNFSSVDYHKVVYLKQAFSRLLKSNISSLELQHLTRVICAILEIEEKGDSNVMGHVASMVSSMSLTSTFQQLSSLFN